MVIMSVRFVEKKHIKGKCPAYGKQCNNCKGKNHFSVVCKKKIVQEIRKDCSDSEESSIYVDSIIGLNDYFHCGMRILKLSQGQFDLN